MKAYRTAPRKTCAIASMALGLLLAATLAPAAAHADEAGESDSLTARFNRIIEPGVPDGYSDDMANPYGKALGENFLLSEQNELLLYYSFDTNGNKKNQHANWYKTFTPGGGTSMTKNNGFAASDAYPDTKAYNYVQAVGFDPNGSGRKDHVAYLGYERTGNSSDKGYYVLWVVDAVEGGQSSVLRVRSATNASCNWLDEHNADLYAGSNFFNIVAGDFDGHGGDDLVISIADDHSYGLSQIRYENGQFTEIAQGERGLLHGRYNERFNAAGSTWANEAKNKLTCDLAVGDYNGDGINDLAVLSYPNKGHAEIGTKAMSSVEFGMPYLAAVAVGNFTTDRKDIEQIAYVVGLQSEDSAHDYSFSVHIASGANYQDNVAGGYQLDTGDYIFYNQQFGLNKRTNCTIAAIDRDNDGVLASYLGSAYSWSDPQVRAILQASPYFSELDDAKNGVNYTSGGGETRYATKTMYSYDTSSSHSTSYGIGAAAELGLFSGRLGFAGNVTKTFMSGMQTEVSNTFTAGPVDTVILCRMPVFMYSYNLSYLDDDGKPATTVYQMAFPKAPVYEQLTLQRYNEFVTYYNSIIEQAGKSNGTPEEAYRQAFLQDVSENLYLGQEGNPYGYYRTDRSGGAGPAVQTQFGDSVGLATNASTTSIDYSYTQTEASSCEVAHGFSFDLTIMGGFSVGGIAAKAGGYASLQYMKEHSTTTTNGKGTSFGGTVMGLDGGAMDADGLDADDWGFTWRLATWNSNLKSGTTDDADYVPVIGYALNSVESPAAPVCNLDAQCSRE